MSEWTPSKADIRRGQNEYFHFVGGIALIHNPDSDFSKRVLGGSPAEDINASLMHAEQLMYHGLRGVIAYANPPEYRKNLQHHAERNYEATLPHIQTMVEDVYEHPSTLGRIRRMNEALEDFRPSAAEDAPTYHNLCHSRPGKLYTITLIDGLKAGALYLPLLRGRTVTAAVAAYRRKSVKTA